MRNTAWAALALIVAACGSAEHQAPYAINPGTYVVTAAEVLDDGCGVAADYGAIGKNIEVHVTGEPKAWEREAAFDFDGTVDRSAWATGTFHGPVMGFSEGGRTYAAAGACVLLIGRNVSATLTADDRLSLHLHVLVFQAPFSPVPCTPADTPAGTPAPGCDSILRLEVGRP